MRRARAFPLTGRSKLVRSEEQWRLEGELETAAPQPLRVTNRYVIRETDRPCTLAWQSVNPAPGSAGGHL